MLKLSSSIIEVSNAEEFRRKLAEATERSEREQLQDEIRRLKRIIRDMQIDKIKSIDQEAELSKSALHSQDHSRLQQEPSRLQQEHDDSGSMEEKPIQKRLAASLLRSRLAEDAGKIIRNNSPERTETRRGSHRGEYVEDEVVMESAQNSSPRRMSTFRKSEENKQQMKDRTIHHFLESSRAIAEEIGKQDIPEPSPISNYDRSRQAESSKHSTINYSRMVEEMKKNNPEEEPPLPEIHLREVKIPALPSPPAPEMAQEALLQLAKQTYKLFGVEIDREGLQLCVKKYKNCVSFSIGSIQSECILWHYSGKFYMGGWKGDGGEGEKNGEGLEVVPAKHVYKGQFLLGKRHGTGIMRLANGNLYDGQWVEGAKNGHGVFLDAATQVVYSGQWKDGRKDGVGLLKLSDKEHYNGTFSQSVKHGHGSETFLNGDRYKGEYHLGKFHGKGKYTWANGSCYEGNFVEGCRHGHGSWKSAATGGDIYIGTYESDRKNGYGRYVWANGCVYEGSFANDVKYQFGYADTGREDWCTRTGRR
jgi:hypothetical protein